MSLRTSRRLRAAASARAVRAIGPALESVAAHTRATAAVMAELAVTIEVLRSVLHARLAIAAHLEAIENDCARIDWHRHMEEDEERELH